MLIQYVKYVTNCPHISAVTKNSMFEEFLTVDITAV